MLIPLKGMRYIGFKIVFCHPVPKAIGIISGSIAIKILK